jgi:hypothetical protein
MRGGTLALLSLLVAAPALAAEPWEGRWAIDAEACAKGADAGDLVPSVFTRHELQFYEATCRVRRASRQGSLWTLAVRCTGEGETDDRVLKLRLLGPDRLRLGETGRADADTAYVRCR